MKKLLAICLTVFMVISLMPAVFAATPAAVAVSATGDTWIEGESYTSPMVKNDRNRYICCSYCNTCYSH